ncbi:hypothetical protein BVX98_05955 [bacterium F11]|nr:hypothetical protein BVX98_05955 [bacterium F11]
MYHMQPQSGSEPNKPNSSSPPQQNLIPVSRFVSTLAAAFRAFFLYKHDNKALDEIIKNVVIRFKIGVGEEPSLSLGITHQSFSYMGNSVGFREVTTYLASTLYTLGIKEIKLTPPLQGRHFFAILNILSGKDSQEAKMGKLAPYFPEVEQKPILLVPITSRSMILRLSDEAIQKTLNPLKDPSSIGGVDFLGNLSKLKINQLPDLFTAIVIQSEPFPQNLKTFVFNLVEATRDGYFPISRFLKVFVLPEDLRATFVKKCRSFVPISTPRKSFPLGQRFALAQKSRARIDAITQISCFSDQEIQARNIFLGSGGHQSVLQDLDFARVLLEKEGPNFFMGLRILLRLLDNENPVAIQEKILKLGIGVWANFQNTVEDAELMSLLSSLRQKLCSVHNITLIIYPIRNLTIESDLFKRMAQFISSLGEGTLPSLLQALDAEGERGMRKKLIILITQVAKDKEHEALIDKMAKASHFLLRNLIMILGDIKSDRAIEAIGSQLHHSMRIVRIEAARSLGKIGTPEAMSVLRGNLPRLTDLESRLLIINMLVAQKDQGATDPIIHTLQDIKLTAPVRRSLYQALASIGGFRAKQHLQSVLDNFSVLDRFKSDEKELHEYIQILIKKMT